VSVDRAEVVRIAELARLRLDEDEVDHLTGDMNRILAYADRLRGDAHAEIPPANGGMADADALEDGRVEDGALDAPSVGGTPAPGFRPGAAELPDPLMSAPASFAPRFEAGFFVVPPPPGVTAGPAPAGPDAGEAP
jgi:aspartyl-tRNA(Asn)/glutamyl-tRNA(Gln) amidotransferase subunit C